MMTFSGTQKQLLNALDAVTERGGTSGSIAEAAHAEIATLQAKVEKLTGALQLVDDSAVDAYHNKRGRRCTLEDGNGEKSWIIPDDTIAHVRAALTPEGEGPWN